MKNFFSIISNFFVRVFRAIGNFFAAIYELFIGFGAFFTIVLAFFALFILLIVYVARKAFDDDVTEETHYTNIDLRIVSINADDCVMGDNHPAPRTCNIILFETIEGELLYREINTCKKPMGVHIDTKWLYNHEPGDTVHFDYLRKDLFFTIKKR